MNGRRCAKIFFCLFCTLLTANIYAAIEITHPHSGNIQQSFIELARTQLENVYEITMPLTGELERINLIEGSKITKGQILAQLVQKPLIQAVNQAQGALQTAEAGYVLETKTLVRNQALLKKGYIDQESVDKIVAYKEMFLAQINKTKAILATAQYNLEKSMISSPIEGVVLKRYTQGGVQLSEGAALLQIGDLNDLEVICDVLTQDAQLLKIGDTVVLNSIGSPATFHGKVKRIEPAGFTKKSSLGVDEQRVNVIISVDNPTTSNLGIAYQLQAKFLVGAQENNAILIPRFSVLQDNQGKYYVFIVKHGKIYKQIVTINIKTDNEISILTNLKTSDEIVSQPTADMHDGMRV